MRATGRSEAINTITMHPLILALLLWRPFIGLAFVPGAKERYQRQPIKLQFEDFEDFYDLDLPTDVNGNGKPTDGADLNGYNNNNFAELQLTLQRGTTSYSDSTSSSLLHKLKSSGFQNDNDVVSFAMDFVSRPEVISQILIQDFQWNAIDAHRARVGITNLVRNRLQTKNVDDGMSLQSNEMQSNISLPLPNVVMNHVPQSADMIQDNQSTNDVNNEAEQEALPKPKLAPWKSVLVNDKAKLRRTVKDRKKLGSVDGKTSPALSDKDSYNYGLIDNDSDRAAYHTLFEELDNLWSFMTVHQANSVAEPPIRERTAEVYMRHARLFLGWVVDARENVMDMDILNDLDNQDAIEVPIQTQSSSPLTASTSKASAVSEAINVRKAMWKRLQQRIEKDATPEDMKRNLSLTDVFKDQSTDSATIIVQYILWMRSERNISSNYEANILRGLIKIVKFRFAGEVSSSTDKLRSATSKTPLDDIPVVIELRKFHRDAGNRSKKAPRSSDEGKKWLDWSEYLEVIELLKADLGSMIGRYETLAKEQPKNQVDSGVKRQKSLQVQQKEIATTFQHYLILSFFACVPDRQRTFRELQLDKNFMRIDGESKGEDTWVIRHSADDYKTGATYGERPPLPLLPSLTPAIDDFIERWRPCLLQNSDDTPPSSFLFHQPKTGNPLSANSMYQIVSRCCYKYKEKKTNPHLLRDMIVTHVRKNSDASEKELEALALYMGHSVQMQRDSYDRRTLEQKVMPAVSLMQSINSVDNPQ